MIEIITEDGKSLDIAPDMVFTIESENPLLSDELMPVPFSTSISFLPTRNNKTVFGYLDTMMLEPSVKTLSVTIFFSGVPIIKGSLTYDGIEDGKLNYTFSGKNVENDLSGCIYEVQGLTRTDDRNDIALKILKSRKGDFALDFGTPMLVNPQHTGKIDTPGEKQEVDVFSMGENQSPVDIAKASLEHARKNGHNVVILDTAGRLHIDEEMMAELQEIKGNVDVHQSLLVVDAMTGQDAVTVAKEFDDKIVIDGVVLSKMDGDTRGGAALSVKAVTGKPILYVGMGEKLSDLEQFYPDRMASRILGMGDVLSFIDKVQANIDIDADKEKEMAARMKKGKFDFEDYLESMKQMKKLGGLSAILGMMPGMGSKMGDIESMVDDKQLAHMEAIVLSMTPAERRNPKLLSPQRKHRIAKGAGVDIAQVNRFIKQFEQSQKMMKQFGGGKRKGFGLGGFPGLGGKGRFPF